MNKWWKTKRTERIATALLISVVVGLVYWCFFLRPYISTDDARVAATVVRVASESVGGRVTKLNVDVGSHVKKGDVLVEIDHRISEAKLRVAQARADFTSKELIRTQRLVKEGGLPIKNLDTAQAEAEKAQAELQLAQVDVEDTTIRSPLNGIVVQKVIEEGDVVSPGQTFVSVADVDNAWISANIEETSVGAVRVGQSVRIWVDEGGELTGKVLEVRHATAAQFALIPAENPSGNFTKLVQRIPVKIALDPHPGLELRTGQSVEIRIKVR
jgi:membrane fusion protein (multidrug efflux system)